jgi:hypothetical protein
LLDIGGGGDDYNDSDNSYDHNHHPSAFELSSSSSSLSSVFQVKFYRQWPTNGGFWFEPDYLLNLFPHFSKDSGHNLGDDCQIVAS